MIHFEFLCLNFQGWEFFFNKIYKILIIIINYQDLIAINL